MDAPGTPSNAGAIRDFVNSYDVETGDEAWSDIEATVLWLDEHDPGCAGLRLREADVVRLRAFREALRDYIEFGSEISDDARRVLEHEMEHCRLQIGFTGDDDVRFICAGEDADTPISSALVRIREAQLAGTWKRLKVCSEHTCRAAFYDHSKNASATWCSMAVCGNRNKARRYRERAKEVSASLREIKA